MFAQSGKQLNGHYVCSLLPKLWCWYNLEAILQHM